MKSMKAQVILQGVVIDLPDVTGEERELLVEGHKCPHCGKTLLVVGGPGEDGADDRSVECVAHCSLCTERVGRIRVEVSTLFGLREDNAVLHGRPRVY